MAFGGSVKLQGANEYKKSLSDITRELKVVSSEMKATSAAFDAGDKSEKEVIKASEDMRKALEGSSMLILSSFESSLPQLPKQVSF